MTDRPADVEGPDPQPTDNGLRPDDLALGLELPQDPDVVIEDGDGDAEDSE
jgi:hypothetical protein